MWPGGPRSPSIGGRVHMHWPPRPGVAVSSSSNKRPLLIPSHQGGPWPSDRTDSPKTALILGWVSSGSGLWTGWEEPAGQG